MPLPYSCPFFYATQHSQIHWGLAVPSFVISTIDTRQGDSRRPKKIEVKATVCPQVIGEAFQIARWREKNNALISGEAKNKEIRSTDSWGLFKSKLAW
jgi:hypothetical protein